MATQAILTARNLRDDYYSVTIEYNHNGKKKMDTGVKVHKKYWCKITRKVKANGAQNVTATNDKLADKLKAVNEVIDALSLSNGNAPPTIAQLTAHYAQQAETVADNEAETTLVTQLDAFIAGKTDWAPATVKAFNTLSKHIQAYQKTKRVTWMLSTLSNENIIDWQHWLLKTHDFNNATLGKLVGKLKTFLTDKQPAQINLSKVKPLHSQMLTPPVVLHQSEIEAIRALPLAHSPRLDRVRDLMVAQIFTGLRFADLMRLEAQHIQKGHIVIRMQKTNKPVRIPCFPQFLEIVAKYTDSETGELHLPRLSNQKFNDYIKEITPLVPSLLKKIEIEFKKRNVTDTKEALKWELITSHSSRRSFCSLCLDLGYSVKETMVWSGHSTLAAFSRYIGLSDLKEDAANDFAARYTAKLGK